MDPDQETSRIELAGVAKDFRVPGEGWRTALRDVTFTVAPGQVCALVGPAGCGKSTTLDLVAGIERSTAGSVRIGGREAAGLVDGVGYMFQQDALLPWKTVLGNVLMGPTYRRVPKVRAWGLARDWLRRLGLAGFENHLPYQLSAAMRKRVAMAVAMINEPRILLMDEPFAPMDVHTKTIMQVELLAMWEREHPSVLFVTHDPEEAVTLADRVVVMTPGTGSVRAVYDIDLPRPRGMVQGLRCDPAFLDARHRIGQALAA